MDILECARVTTIDTVEWVRSVQPVPYLEAMAAMERRVDAILAGRAAEAVWLLEHPPVYTGGVSGRPEEVLAVGDVPVVPTTRGGRYTFHGPGQRIAYLMLDLRARGRDVRRFVAAIEAWVIAALADLGVKGERRAGRVGIWVAATDGSEAKIAAIGLRIRRWVSSHGIAINVDPELAYFDGIVPCGLAHYGITSLAALGRPTSMTLLDASLIANFTNNFINSFPRRCDVSEQNASTHRVF
jgi:lipoyl(octanoyl) transferase